MKTKTAVTSLRSLGSRPPRSASATIRRKSTEPMIAPTITNAQIADADQRLADDDAGQSPDDHPDPHLHVGKALILGQERARHRNQAVRQREPEHDHVVDVDAEGPNHLRVVTGGLHRGAQVGAEEEIEQCADRSRDAQARARGPPRRACSPPNRDMWTLEVPSHRIAALSAIEASVRSDKSGRLLFPMMCRFTE